MASCLEEYTQPTHNELSLDVGASCGSRPPGTLSPTLRVRGYYVQDLPVNILSKNAIKDEHGSAFANSKPDVRTEHSTDSVSGSWASRTCTPCGRPLGRSERGWTELATVPGADLWGLEESMSPEGKREISFYSCCFVLVTKRRALTLSVSFRIFDV